MSTSSTLATRLVADIGGTNSRLALFDPGTSTLYARRSYINRDYGQFEDIVAEWIDTLELAPPIDCCLAVAAPPFDDRVTMLNIDWSFSLRELASRFGFSHIRGINDFEGNAYALPHLGDRDKITFYQGSPNEHGKLATLGPGTGLGGSTLDLDTASPKACASEPGHMGLAPATALELELFRYLVPLYGEIYAESLVSGPGLQRLYQSLAVIGGHTALTLSSEEITTRAQQGDCDLCTLTLNTFCALLGSVSGDFVLANGAYGGLFLAGGFIPQMVDFLRASTFISRFQEKGKMQAHLKRVPLHVITCDSTGLIGAAHAPV